MHIVFVASEAVPFSKTGGLGDVAGALPAALAEAGHTVTLITPYYRAAKKVEPKAQSVAEGAVPVGNEMIPWSLHRSELLGGSATAYLLGNEKFFDRDGIYGTPQGDFPDSCSRYIFFSRAALAAAQALEKPVDVYHAHDWQAALIPTYLRLSLYSHPFHGSAASLFTIHNLSYQGLFWHWDWPLLNLPWKHFNWKEMEFYGKVNLMKAGILYSDVLNTVSTTYAQEIQTPQFGFGLEGVLTDRHEDLFGVVNGIDTRMWSPRTDPLLPAQFDVQDLRGKERCRQALLARFGLPEKRRVPVVAMVGRLIEQKGLDLLIPQLGQLFERDLTLILLGTGPEKYQAPFQRLKEIYPDKIALSFAFDNALSHLIQAGADLFLMPSRFEPCGLNQLYSLGYGTIPLVHQVGGLSDTVTDATPENLAAGTATGFVFKEFTPAAMMSCLDRALDCFKTQPKAWKSMQQTGMRQDWSWSRSAQEYVKLYERAREKAKGRAG